MASWGQAAVGGNRPTAVQPSRSALIGLLAAALGIKRTQEEQLQQLQASIHLAVKQCVPSMLIRDYHTSQVPSSSKKIQYRTRKQELSSDSLNTILSSRDYRCDGLWTVAISLKKHTYYTLQELANGLKNPVFSLYLGRKSCPLSIPLEPKLIKVQELKEALDFSFSPLLQSSTEDAMYLGKTGYVTYFWEGDKNALNNPSVVMLTRPWDEPLHRGRWQFTQRDQYQCTIKEII